MADDTLQQAISLIKAGKDSEARGLLYHLVKTDPRNEMAWLWLSETMNENQRLATLEQGLKFNPGSKNLQHAMDRIKTKQQASARPETPPAQQTRPAPSIPTPAVDKSNMQTARLTFMPDEDGTPPAKKQTPSASAPDRSQVKTSQLPPPPDQIDRSVMRAARYNVSPDTLAPNQLPPEMQMPEKRPAQKTPKLGDQTNIKTSQLAYEPGEPVGKPLQPPTQPAPPAQPPSDRIDRSLLKAARFEQAEPVKTGPLKVPPPAAAVPLAKPTGQLPPSTGSLASKPPSTGQLPPTIPPIAKGTSTGQLPPAIPPASKAASTGQLPTAQPERTPPSAAEVGAAVAAASQAATPPPPPVKPQAKSTAEPAPAVRQQMDALLSEPHPSPDPVPKTKKGSAPPPPKFPPVKEEAEEPKKKRRRRLSGFDVFLIIIVVLLILGIAGFLAWDTFGPQPPTPTAAPLPPVVIPMTSTLPATNTPQATPTPIPPPTLRPTFTPIVSPTPTLDPSVPSILFMDPASCAVRQVSSTGGAAQLLTESMPANCVNPELSLDGMQFAYLQALGSESTDTLSVSSANGSTQSTVVENAGIPIWEADWAPDNVWLSYTSQVGMTDNKPTIGIYLIRADGTNKFQLTDESVPSIIPDSKDAMSWSPDGQWIAFYADNLPYIIHPDGSGLDQLSENAGMSSIVWSSDSRQIAFYSSDLNNPGIVVIGVDGKSSFVKNNAFKPPVSGDALLWMPDGNRFVAYDVAEKALVLINRNGLQVETIASVGGIPTRLALSPDGKQLAFIELLQQGSSSGVLKVVNIDGTDLTTLVVSAGNAPLIWMSPSSLAGVNTPVPPEINVPTTTPNPNP